MPTEQAQTAEAGVWRADRSRSAVGFRVRSEFFDTDSYPSISLQARAHRSDRRLLGEAPREAGQLLVADEAHLLANVMLTLAEIRPVNPVRSSPHTC